MSFATAKTTLFALVFIALLLSAPEPATAAESAEPAAARWSITPYIWAPTTTIDLAYQGIDIGGQTIKVKDVLDKVDAAFMINVEYGKGHWSTFADLTYIDLSDTSVQKLTTIDTRFEQVLLDAGVSYWPAGIGTSLNLIAGLRRTGSDNRFTFRRNTDGTVIGSLRSDEALNDALLGLRYSHDFNDKWSLWSRGDVSFGDSEGTVLLQLNLMYTVGKKQQNRFVFGYQYRKSELRDGELTTDMVLSGPAAGYSFRF